MKVRKAVILAGTVTTAAAATALIAVPAFATAATSASADAATHTLHFTAVSAGTHYFGRTGGVEIDKDSHNGKVIAYDELDFVSANGADVALGLKDGFLYGKFTTSKSGKITGKITGGTAAYKGDTGTIKGQGEKDGAHVTVTYRH